MSLKNLHPQFEDISDEYEKINDVLGGSRVVKNKGVHYLPATSGQVVDGYGKAGTLGQQNYESYITRAIFPSTYETALRRILGILHRNPANIKLPDSMKALYTDADGAGTSIYDLLKKINEYQLGIGRCGVLGDIKVLSNNKILPVLKIYSGTAIPNWSEDCHSAAEFVLLNETGQKMNPESFKYEEIKQYRVIRVIKNAEGESTYVTATTNNESDEISELTYISPNAQGATLEELPFSFINAGDTKCCISMPPMSGLADMCISIYRSSADLEQALFNTSSDTLVITRTQSIADDEDETIRTGAGSVIKLGKDDNAKFIGVNSKSIPSQRQNIEYKHEMASQLASQLAIESKSSRTSQEALATRLESATAAYSALALAGAAGLENSLRKLAPLFGVQNPTEEIVVTPNLEFAAAVLDSDTFVDLQSAKNNGLPLSNKSLHKNLVKRGVTEMTYEEEQAAIAAEETLL